MTVHLSFTCLRCVRTECDVIAEMCFYWLKGLRIEKMKESPSELLEEDVEVETFLGVDEGNLWTETTDVDKETTEEEDAQ